MSCVLAIPPPARSHIRSPLITEIFMREPQLILALYSNQVHLLVEGNSAHCPRATVRVVTDVMVSSTLLYMQSPEAVNVSVFASAVLLCCTTAVPKSHSNLRSIIGRLARMSISSPNFAKQTTVEHKISYSAGNSACIQ